MTDRTPSRQDLTLLPGDESGQKKIGFVCYERNGVCCYKRDAIGQPLCNREDIQVGDEILVPALQGNYCWVVTVREDENGSLYGEGERFVYPLEFNGDDRHAWVVTMVINKRGITKTHLSSTP